MKQFALALTTVLATGALALAGSDSKDMKQVATSTPPVSCDYTWTGFYLGAHIGYGWSTGDTSFEALPSPAAFGALETQKFSSDADGIFGGGQFGYNYQWNKLVFGVRGRLLRRGLRRHQASQSDRASSVAARPPGILTAHEDTDWFGTFRGRFGFTPMCRLLLYGTGGLAFAHNNYFANTDFGVIAYPGEHRRNQRGLDGWRRP